MGSAQLRTRRPIHLGRIIQSEEAGLSGLTGPDYPVCLTGRIIRAGLLRKSGPYAESCARESSRGPDYPVLSGRIIRPEFCCNFSFFSSCVRFLLGFHASVLLVLDSNTSLAIFSSCLRFLLLFQASVLVVLSSITPLAPSRVIMHEERFLATQGAFGSNSIPFTCKPMES